MGDRSGSHRAVERDRPTKGCGGHTERHMCWSLEFHFCPVSTKVLVGWPGLPSV